MLNYSVYRKNFHFFSCVIAEIALTLQQKTKQQVKPLKTKNIVKLTINTKTAISAIAYSAAIMITSDLEHMMDSAQQENRQLAAAQLANHDRLTADVLEEVTYTPEYQNTPELKTGEGADWLWTECSNNVKDLGY